MKINSCLMMALLLGVINPLVLAKTYHCPENFNRTTAPEPILVGNHELKWHFKTPMRSDENIRQNQFVNAFYHPDQQKIVCTYRSSAGEWVTVQLIIKPDKLSDAWTYNKKKQFYICGIPLQEFSQCSFEMNGPNAL